MLGLIRKIVGTKNERELKRIQQFVVRTNALESSLQPLSDAELSGKTPQLRERVEHGESLEALLPEAFAVVREASRRVLGMRHFDAQLIGGVVLHEGKIAEMKTGEGKTLVATLPVYLNALTGRGVHVITVNDYLARRDAEWMGPLYKFLGCSVGVILHGLTDTERAWAYRADLTYGTNNEFGFDYLRDNMKFGLEQYVQRELHYAIVDEVDSILIDEARTPLIISGQGEQSTDLYYVVNQIMPFLKKTTHFTIDEKARSAVLTEDGVHECERLLKVENLYDPRQITLLHHVHQGLRAHSLYQRDVEYVVKDGQVVIVDEFTGRLMPGRRWSDGLHQAVEAKEGVKIENENQTLATVTFQNFFRMYKKLAGMTGTADTEAAEFAKIYNLEVVVIPTNRPMVRDDRDDLIYKTEEAKFQAVVDDIKECHERGQPVLVGTISIEKSERLSTMLKRTGIPHHVLNAKHHEREAEIISQAGRHGGVTISTNMAGRGTDIMLGGNPEGLARTRRTPEMSEDEFHALVAEQRARCSTEHQAVVAAGGLCVIGTERHESRRIDNQLRGRSGRQGDPGASRFYLSLEDDLLRIFGGDRIKVMMERMGMKDDEVIEHRWLNRAIANAQRRVEEHNFSIRKNLLEYDDVMNQQRHQVYGRRREILGKETLGDVVLDLGDQMVGHLVDTFLPERIDPQEFDGAPLLEQVRELFNLQWDLAATLHRVNTRQEIGSELYATIEGVYRAKVERYGVELFTQVERFLLLTTLDTLWKEHLLQMDHLREGIGLRGYAQKDPLVEYKREGFALFQQMMQNFAKDVLEKVYRVEIKAAEAEEAVNLAARPVPPQRVMATGGAGARLSSVATNPGVGRGPAPMAPRAQSPTVQNRETVLQQQVVKAGRNDPCPCGSGKKYKKCCGA